MRTFLSQVSRDVDFLCHVVLCLLLRINTNNLACSPVFQEIPVHVAEVLRQVSRSEVPEGGWTGGDAWFGSIACCVTVKQVLNVESTFVIKNHTTLYPKRPLQAILKARHGTRPAGHWVVLTTKISGVDIIAIAYAWSQSSTAFFVSTVGTTAPARDCYCTNFEDEFGMVQSKLIPRPDICDFIFRFLPIIDNHNKSRQHHLGLERKWPTTCCWFRLFVSLVGFSVVDLHRLYKNHDAAEWGNVTILQFSDQLCNGLIPRVRKTLPKALRDSAVGADVVKRIENSGGSTTKAVTKKQQKGKHCRTNIGSGVQKSCWICRLYQKGDAETKAKYTTWMCQHCDTPICHPNHTYDENKRSGWKTCLNEHLHTGNPLIRCDGNSKGQVRECLKK
jgi:hypothetical protein